MTNEMKLLTAFIEAQGYKVEELIDNIETPISEQAGIDL